MAEKKPQQKPSQKPQEQNEFSKLEENIIEYWQEHKIFEKSIENRQDAAAYVFYDGPPFATGLPHYGHILASTIKDVVPRYWTMKGFKVDRVWGWDCHGLPIENIIEQKLGINSRKEIEQLGIDKFCDECRKAIFVYDKEWEKTISRIGRWVDFKNSYKTMDRNYIESVWWAFKTLFDKGLVYKGSRTALYCPRCETPLTNFEIAMDNSYKDVSDPSVYVWFESGEREVEGKMYPRYFLAWTTTPWTLPGNRALAVKSDSYYVEVFLEKEKKVVVLAKERMLVVMDHLGEDDYTMLEDYKGSELAGQHYEPIYTAHGGTQTEKDFTVYTADFVTMTDGSGIVHIAPSFGEDDNNLGIKVGLEVPMIINSAGQYNELVPEWVGINVWEANASVIKWLQENGKLFKQEMVHHSYPFCHRCSTKLLFYTSPAWYINIQKIKPALVENNEYINWFPGHLKHGRFGNGLKDAPDWCVSRSRYWGSPMPIWECDKCDDRTIIGSFAELKKFAPETPDDIDFHRPMMDDVHFKCACGGTKTRIKEVFDCWVESGSMPYASKHYPFENKEKFEDEYPAQFISEYIAQTRGWFYTLHVLSIALFGKPSFVNCVTTGTIMAEDGTKMSKSKRNFPDPAILFNKYGVDALRFYLMSSSVMNAENVNFAEKDVDEVYKKVILMMWNLFSFWKMYAPVNEKDFPLESVAPSTEHMMDKWMVALLEKTIKDVTASMDGYDMVRSTRAIVDAIADFSQWYVRRSRERMKAAATCAPGTQEHNEALAGLATLRYVLWKMSQIIAPFVPFIAERIYQGLHGVEESVHLTDWPEARGEYASEEILQKMQKSRQIVEVALALRAELNLKVRQPLAVAQIKGEHFSEEYLEIIKDELNVKKVECVADLHNGDNWRTKEGAGFCVALNIEISPELKAEGMLRDVVRKINLMRKEQRMTVADRIAIYWNGNKEFLVVFDKLKKELMASTLAQKVEESKELGAEGFEIKGEEFKTAGVEVLIGIKKL